MAIDLKQLQSAAGKPGKSESTAAAKKSHNNVDSGFRRFLVKQPSASDRMFFTEQLSLLLETGNGLVPSLRMLSTQAENPELRRLIRLMIDDVNSGRSFSRALGRHPQLFSSTYVNLIAVSEQGGFMPQVLAELLDMDDKREQLNATLKSALAYPLFLLCFSLAVVVFILVFVFPKFADMFASIADQLPATTLVLMTLSQILISHWPFFVAAIIGCFLLFRKWAHSASGNYQIDRLKLAVPVLKNIFSELYLVQSLRVMALSLGNGVSVMDTLVSCREVVHNRVFQQFIASLEVCVQDGKGIANGFQSVDFVPNIVKQMVLTGEQSGNLSKVLHRVAGYYERQLDKRLVIVAKAAEPVMLLLMGVVVGTLVSSLILPIFKLSRAVG